MNVSLTPQLESWIQEQVEGGLYQSSSEVVRDAVRVFQRYQAAETSRLVGLRAEIMKGIDSADRGELTDADEKFFQSVKERGRSRMTVD